jgi:hypothetical protein
MTKRQYNVNVAIYGEISKSFGGKHIAILDLSIPTDYHLGDLLCQIEIPMEETSFIFVDAVLCDVPGLTIEHDEPLRDGSHVGIFSRGYIWPYQYRDGVPMSEPLKQAMSKHGAMHHSYTKID